MKIGDVLICKKGYQKYDNVNIVGKKYLILNIEDNGNIYVSTDLIKNNEIIDGFGVSWSYSIINNSIYSSLYIDDYFIELSQLRIDKLKELGI